MFGEQVKVVEMQSEGGFAGHFMVHFRPDPMFNIHITGTFDSQHV